MFHWCADETLMVMLLIPFIGMFFRKLHLWYHTKIGHRCHKDKCDETHPEHNHEKND